MVQQEQPARVG